ncbi:hypothetical protein EXIGLDRAFT_831669 [Exidia glandulosa HHB12029]|uniref:Uncharacterized protein n=1 Tax=Exidia glandulosa HHB12029 TaxID=1314781 RepID=A0A165MD83_EXIGL|nr:hypothetical protein EXIGLDRAFT_831669 [Exidia glandulosa HHB12029]
MSALSRVRTASRLNAPSLRVTAARRSLHASTPIAAKKKGKDGDGDMFGGGGSGPRVRESYTFGASSALPQLAAKVETEALKEDKPAGPLTFAEKREKQFDTQLEHARKLLRSKIHWERKLVRHGTLRRLIALADSPEQLRHVAALFPDWAADGYILDDDTASSYIGRCIKFGKPQIAVTLLLNPRKHKFNLPSMASARKLLQSLIEHGTTLRNMMAYLSLYTVYRLPPAASDPATAAMVISACLKNGSPEAKEIAQEFAKGVSAETEGVQSTRVEKEWRTRLNELSASISTMSITPDAAPQASAATA